MQLLFMNTNYNRLVYYGKQKYTCMHNSHTQSVQHNIPVQHNKRCKITATCFGSLFNMFSERDLMKIIVVRDVGRPTNQRGQRTNGQRKTNVRVKPCGQCKPVCTCLSDHLLHMVFDTAKARSSLRVTVATCKFWGFASTRARETQNPLNGNALVGR